MTRERVMTIPEFYDGEQLDHLREPWFENPNWQKEHDSFDTGQHQMRTTQGYIDDTYDYLFGENEGIFGELIQAGWDWGEEQWESYAVKPEVLDGVYIQYDEDGELLPEPIIIQGIRWRLNRKIRQEFFLRELGMSPPGAWAMMFRRTLEDAVDRLGPKYNAIYDGLELTPLDETRSRRIESDYPQAQLQTVQKDYASSGSDLITERVAPKTLLELLTTYDDLYREPDRYVLDRLDRCFSQLLGF